MTTHRFTTTIVVAGKRYEAGHEVDAAEIPAGNLASLTRQGQLEPIPIAMAPVPTPIIEVTPADLVPVLANSEPAQPDDGDDPDATPAELAKKTPPAPAPAPTKKK